ncbi:AP2-like ethylene-responsive transcription factor PLT1 [Cucurbita argyrosperma subsp. argyrosperma]|nr:AP2-like ethylene-responsive transcription factor PLT1 [Cucurbita argyrosperma subsp. argyrosperma]
MGSPAKSFERYSLIFPFTLFFFPVLPLFLKKMGSINSNNCLSCPLPPTNPSSSLPEVPFQAPNEWNLISSEGGGEAPKVADFLGVSKAENETHLMGFNEIHADYLFPITPFNVDSTTTNSNSLQCLNLSMGSGKGEPPPPPPPPL